MTDMRQRDAQRRSAAIADARPSDERERPPGRGSPM